MLSPFQMKLNLALEICQKLRGTTQQNHTNVADCKATPSEPQRTRACTDIACFFPMILIWCRNILMLVRGLRISKQELLNNVQSSSLETEVHRGHRAEINYFKLKNIGSGNLYSRPARESMLSTIIPLSFEA